MSNLTQADDFFHCWYGFLEPLLPERFLGSQGIPFETASQYTVELTLFYGAITLEKTGNSHHVCH